MSRVTLLGLLLLEAIIRAPAFTQGGFVSHDVAGILYSAMVFHDGGLPYVDTVELKAPGTFYLAWAFAGADGRDIEKFQVLANLWAMLGTCIVFTLMTRARGLVAGAVAGMICVLQQPWLDSMDANYVTWANTFQVGAFAAVWRGPGAVTSTRARDWILAGALAAVAALCKRQAVFLFVPLIWCTVFIPACGESSHGARWRRLGGLALGACGPLFAVLAHYASHGEAWAFIRGYALNDWGWNYVSFGGGGGVLETVAEGCLATTYFLALPLALMVLGMATQGRSGARGWGAVLVWLASMIVAAWIGGRFYKGYFALTLAPAAMLAGGAVATVLARWRQELKPRAGRLVRRAVGLVLTLVITVLVFRGCLLLWNVRGARDVSRDAGARRIATHVVAHSSPSDTIWVWGWHLWDLYPLSGRMAASSIYKSLGVLTPANDDSWRKRARPLHFGESLQSDRLLRELKASNPRYIVLGSTVPHREFKALRAYLASAYVRDHRLKIGRVEMWRLRDASRAR